MTLASPDRFEAPTDAASLNAHGDDPRLNQSTDMSAIHASIRNHQGGGRPKIAMALAA